MGGPDDITANPPPRVPPPLGGGTAAIPPVTGDGAATGPGTPRADHYEWRTLGTSYIHGSGGFLSNMMALFSGTGRINAVESEIAELVTRSQMATGPALGDTMTRLTRLRQVLDSLHTLDSLGNIHRTDIDALRRTAVEKLLAGAANPPNETDYQEGLRMLRALQRYQALETRRDQLTTQVQALYVQPHDDVVLYRLDYSGPEFAHLDSWRYPTVQALNDQRVLQTYRSFDAAGPVATSVRDLFGHMRAQDGVFANDVTGTATMETLDAATRDLEGVFSNADLQTFFQRLGTSERDAMMANEGSRVRLNATESLAMIQQYPSLAAVLSRYDVLVGATRPVEEQQRMLQDTSHRLVLRGERYLELLRSQPQSAERDRDIATIQSGLSELRSVEGTLNASGLSRESLSAAAARIAPVVTSFQPFEERNLRDALTRMIGQIEQLPSPENNIQPIRDALAAITPDAPATPADRLAAYRNVAQMIDQATTVRLIDARIHMYQQQLRQVNISDHIVEGLNAGPAPNASTPDEAAAAGLIESIDYLFGGHRLQDRLRQEQQLAAEHHQTEDDFRRMIREYQDLRTAVTSGDPATAAQGRHDLQRLEGASVQGTLQGTAETAQLVNMLTIGAGIILVAALTAEFGGLALAAGAESLLGGTALAVGTQEIIVGAVYYSSMTVIFTGVQRGLNSTVYGSEANEHSFMVDLLINGAMFGVVGGAMRGVGRLITGCVERVAIANLERTGALVLAREGTESMSRFAMDTASRAAVEREMARIMEGFTARLGTGAATLGTEYVMFNLFTFAQTAAELSARHDSDPFGHAASAVLSPKGQARIGAFLIAMRALNTAAEPFTAPIRDRLSNLLGEQFLSARIAELERNVATLSQDFAEGRVADPAELVTRTRALLEQRQRILMEAHGRETMPSEDIEREFGANERALQQLDRMSDFLRGIDRISGEGNAFGVTPFSDDGSVFTYRPGQAQAIVDAINALPGGVDRANVRVHPNGMIEVPFLASPFMPESRTVYLIPANAAGRRPSGSAIVVRPASATP